MAIKQNDGVRAGLRIEPPVARRVMAWLLSRASLVAVVNGVNSWLNCKFKLTITAPDGSKITRQISPVISNFNSIVELPIDLVSAGVSSGGYVNEYNPARAYPAGSLFLVSRNLVVDGKTIPQGFWSVPIAETDVLGQGWSGSLPANPTGNDVPQDPPFGLASAKLIAARCP